MSIGIPIARVGSRGFRVTRKGRVGGSLTIDKGGGRVEAVLNSAEGAKCDTD